MTAPFEQTFEGAVAFMKAWAENRSKSTSHDEYGAGQRVVYERIADQCDWIMEMTAPSPTPQVPDEAISCAAAEVMRRTGDNRYMSWSPVFEVWTAEWTIDETTQMNDWGVCADPTDNIVRFPAERSDHRHTVVRYNP